MKTSLCAKLMSFRMPYTIVYPRATRAIIDPWASPVTRALAIFCSIAATIPRPGVRGYPRGGRARLLVLLRRRDGRRRRIGRRARPPVLDGGEVGELLPLDLHDDDGLVRVALGVDRDPARRALEVLRVLDRLAEGVWRVVLRAADGVGEELGRVVAHGGEARRVVLEALVVLDPEALRVGPGDVGRVEVREVGALELVARVVQELVRVPAVAAGEHVALDARRLPLPGDEGKLVIVDGGVDDVGLRVLQLVQVRREVGLLLQEALLLDELAAL